MILKEKFNSLLAIIKKITSYKQYHVNTEYEFKKFLNNKNLPENISNDDALFVFMIEKIIQLEDKVEQLENKVRKFK